MGSNIVELYSLEVDGTVVLVGLNLDTRELSFYTEKNGVILPVSQTIRNQTIKMISQQSEVYSNEFKTMLENSINSCRNYNDKKGYSNLNLEKNTRHLSVLCSKSDLSQSSASYDVFNNTFTFALPDQYWDLSGISGFLKARTINQITSHEVGHMSVSDISIDNDNNLVGSIGFLQMKMPIRTCIETSDGSNYYILDKKQEIIENGARGLEELFNELENDERTNSSITPNFAYRLDRITDGKLRFARQNHSLTDYYISMQNIVPSRDKAMLLLMGIEAYYSCERQQNEELASKLEEKISQILTDYEIKKSSISNQITMSDSTKPDIGDDSHSR